MLQLEPELEQALMLPSLLVRCLLCPSPVSAPELVLGSMELRPVQLNQGMLACCSLAVLDFQC